MLYICVWLTTKHAEEYLSFYLYAGENYSSENLPSGQQNPCTYAQGYLKYRLEFNWEMETKYFLC